MEHVMFKSVDELLESFNISKKEKRARSLETLSNKSTFSLSGNSYQRPRIQTTARFNQEDGELEAEQDDYFGEGILVASFAVFPHSQGDIASSSRLAISNAIGHSTHRLAAADSRPPIFDSGGALLATAKEGVLLNKD